MATPLVVVPNDPNPPLPFIPPGEDFTYIKSWMYIHKLSTTTWLYAYLLWLFIISFVLTASVLHVCGTREAGVLGARFSKIFLKRKTFRKPGTLADAKKKKKAHTQPYSLPSYAQILTLTMLFVVSIGLSILGPDYLKPSPTPANAPTVIHFSGAIIPNDVHPANYVIEKAWWTFGGRTGLIAFALFPLCILLGLKYPPFAVFALSFTTEYYFDKLVRVHRWTGRLIYGLTTAHVLGYALQAFHDKRNPGDNRNVWHFVVLHLPFRYAIVAYVSFTLLMLSTLDWVRKNMYETFYACHVFFIPMTLIFSALHHQALAWWCWGSLIIWVVERSARGIRWLFINTAMGGNMPRYKRIKDDPWSRAEDQRWEMAPMAHDIGGGAHHRDFSLAARANEMHEQDIGDRGHRRGNSSVSIRSPVPRGSSPVYAQERPPPGYAHAQLLPGRTIKLRILTSGPFTWAPGQHVLVCIPSISKFTSHPFTVASICDQEAGGDQEVVLLIRAKSGFTKALWDDVSGQMMTRLDATERPDKNAPPAPKRGAFLRAYVDGPFGSSIRTKWGQHSTAVIFAGGSGVSFAVAVMEYLCMCLAGRDGAAFGARPGGQGDPRFCITRVRFVWMIREFSHLQWCASTIRKCMDLVPPSILTVNIFVSNYKTMESSDKMPRPMSMPTPIDKDGMLMAPRAPYARGRKGDGSADDEGAESDVGNASLVDLSQSLETNFNSAAEDLGHESHILDLTNFDGENDARLPGEAQFSYRVKKEGKLRRARTRKLQATKKPDSERPLPVPSLPGQSSGPVSPPHTKTGFTPSPLSTEMSTEGEYDARGRHGRTLTEGSIDAPFVMSPQRGAPGDRSSQYLEPPRQGRGRTSSRPSSPVGERTERGRSPSPAPSERTLGGGRSRPASLYGGSEGGHSRPSSIYGGEYAESVRGVRIEIEDKEAEDIDIVSENTLPGKPKFEQILAEEVERARGSVAVGCCGPTALNAVIRNCVASQISPERVAMGDMRGYLTLVSEDFEY